MGVAMMVGIGLAAAPAGAQETDKKAPAAAAKKKDDNYGYVFKDDLLDAPGLGGNAATITVIPLGRRDRLLRPRVHFIPEMLKSVESM
jgi:hypothetical protein